MQSKATTPAQYLAELPVDRRAAISEVRKVFLKNLKPGFEEAMVYGMIGFVVPKKLYPPGYHCDPSLPLSFAALASQKNHMAIYLMCHSNDKERAKLQKAFAAIGKKLDMGKSCIRFNKLDDIPLQAIGEIIGGVSVKQYIERYEKALGQAAKGKAVRSGVRSATRGAAVRRGARAGSGGAAARGSVKVARGVAKAPSRRAAAGRAARAAPR
jgi:hypothetical protein